MMWRAKAENCEQIHESGDIKDAGEDKEKAVHNQRIIQKKW